MTLCLATNNPHKVEELQQLLGDKFEIKTLSDIGFSEDVEETENTFQGNSLLKARAVHTFCGLPTISDDSGLEVDALNGEPGVFSARYAGEHGNHAKNNEKLLKILQDQTNRSAQFRSVITFITTDNSVHQFEGIVRGELSTELSGTDGFGYDPLFKPEGYNRTFAEMSMEEKNPISHRGIAVAKLIEHLKDITV